MSLLDAAEAEALDNVTERARSCVSVRQYDRAASLFEIRRLVASALDDLLGSSEDRLNAAFTFGKIAYLTGHLARDPLRAVGDDPVPAINPEPLRSADETGTLGRSHPS